MKVFVSMLSLSLFVFAAHAAETKIQFTKDAKKAAAGQNPYTCKGEFSQADVLKKMGSSDKELAAGLPCEKADFDGNGSPDFFFQKCDANLRCSSVVVLMQKEKFPKAVDLKQDSILEVFAPKQKLPHGGLKDLGCKIPKVGALVQTGEGDGNENIIFTLNKDQTGFTEFTRCSNMEGGD